MSSSFKEPQRGSLALHFSTAPSASSLAAALSHNPSCTNLSDCANDNSAVDGLETYDVGEYHLTACPICLEHFTLDNPAILLRCEHGFHLQCLESWRQRSSVCPMCFSPIIGDEGRIMSPSDARRRRRLRLRTPTAALNTCERSVLISAAARPGGGDDSEHDDDALSSEHGTETNVIEVTSAEEDPHGWCGWLWYCCSF